MSTERWPRWPDGRYEAPPDKHRQAPIVVVNGGARPDGYQGPWVRWRFLWEKDESAAACLEPTFAAMVEKAGYVHVPGGSTTE